MTFRERVEANAVLWLLGCLLTGFLSGISAYRAIQQIAGLEPVSQADYEDLQKKAKDLASQNQALQSELDQAKAPAATGHSVAPTASSALAAYPELRGVSVRIWFPSRLTAKAAEIESKLERLGMEVKLSPREQKVDQSLGSVYYFKNGSAAAAVKLAAVLAPYGFQSTRFENSDEKNDLAIWLWAQ